MTTNTLTQPKVVRQHPNRTDAQQVEVMSGLGTDEEHIASHLSISIEELRHYYQTQLDNGPKEANLRVAQVFHEMATSGNFPLLTAKWMELRAGWTPVRTDNTMSEEELQHAHASAKQKLQKLLNRGE